MSQTFRDKVGYVLAILFLVLVFTAMGIVFAPTLAPLLEFFMILDIGLLVIVFGAAVASEIKERYL